MRGILKQARKLKTMCKEQPKWSRGKVFYCNIWVVKGFQEPGAVKSFDFDTLHLRSRLVDGCIKMKFP